MPNTWGIRPNLSLFTDVQFACVSLTPAAELNVKRLSSMSDRDECPFVPWDEQVSRVGWADPGHSWHQDFPTAEAFKLSPRADKQHTPDLWQAALSKRLGPSPFVKAVQASQKHLIQSMLLKCYPQHPVGWALAGFKSPLPSPASQASTNPSFSPELYLP